MNSTRLAEMYIEGHPSIKDCVKKRLINYSKLSREIIKSSNSGRENFDAVLIACRRYYRKISSTAAVEDEIIRLLANSKLEVKNKVSVVVIENSIYSDDLINIEKKAKKAREIFYAIEGTDAITVVIAMDFIPEMKAVFKSSIIKVWEDVALVTIRSAAGKQDTTPGFLSFITSKLSQQGINILEIMSCWSETLLVVSEADIARVLQAFKFS